MFLDFSLCPGGAFMLHEDASEYDERMNNPHRYEHHREHEHAMEHVKERLNRYHKEHGRAYDPVMALTHKTEDVYEKLRELYNVNLEPESPQEALSTLDAISRTASMVTDRMRLCLVKQGALYDFMNRENLEWTFELVLVNAGLLLKNRDKIYNAGYDKVDIAISDCDFIDMYSYRRAWGMYHETVNGMPDYPMTVEQLNRYVTACGSPVLRRFESLSDMFNCFYHDQERLMRIEGQSVNTLAMDYIFDDIVWKIHGAECDRPVCERTTKPIATALIRWMSTGLREIKRGVYDLECDIIDKDVVAEIARYHKAARSMISTLHDMFAWSMILMLGCAYDIRRAISYREGVNRFVSDIMSKMKNGEI